MVPTYIIRALAISDDLRKKPWRGHPNLFAGHCYVLSEVLYYLIGGKETGWKPMFVRVNGCPHWFLKHDDGTVLDYTAEQFSFVSHHKAVGKGFLTKRLSKRAKILLERMEKCQC